MSIYKSTVTFKINPSEGPKSKPTTTYPVTLGKFNFFIILLPRKAKNIATPTLNIKEPANVLKSISDHPPLKYKLNVIPELFISQAHNYVSILFKLTAAKAIIALLSPASPNFSLVLAAIPISLTLTFNKFASLTFIIGI